MKASVLGRVPLFASAPGKKIEHLEATLQSVQAPPGTILFREGGASDHFYIVLAGRTEVIKAMGTEGEQRRFSWPRRALWRAEMIAAQSSGA